MLFKRKKSKEEDDTQAFQQSSAIDKLEEHINEINLNDNKRTTTEALRIIQKEELNANTKKSNTYLKVDVDMSDINLELEKFAKENRILKSQVKKYKEITPKHNDISIKDSSFSMNSMSENSRRKETPECKSSNNTPENSINNIVSQPMAAGNMKNNNSQINVTNNRKNSNIDEPNMKERGQVPQNNQGSQVPQKEQNDQVNQVPQANQGPQRSEEIAKANIQKPLVNLGFSNQTSNNSGNVQSPQTNNSSHDLTKEPLLDIANKDLKEKSSKKSLQDENMVSNAQNALENSVERKNNNGNTNHRKDDKNVIEIISDDFVARKKAKKEKRKDNQDSINGKTNQNNTNSINRKKEYHNPKLVIQPIAQPARQPEENNIAKEPAQNVGFSERKEEAAKNIHAENRNEQNQKPKEEIKPQNVGFPENGSTKIEPDKNLHSGIQNREQNQNLNKVSKQEQLQESMNSEKEKKKMPEKENMMEKENELNNNTSFLDEKTEILEPIKAPEVNKYSIKRLSTGEVIKLSRNIFRIGKDKNFADYHINNNATVSRKHAEFIIKNNTIYIKDLNSTNGVMLGEFKIPPMLEVEVKDGQEIIISNEHFILTKEK